MEILERVQEFYGELYKRGGVDEASMDEVLECVEKELGEEDRIWCDKEIEEKEVIAALESSRSGKGLEVMG